VQRYYVDTNGVVEWPHPFLIERKDSLGCTCGRCCGSACNRCCGSACNLIVAVLLAILVVVVPLAILVVVVLLAVVDAVAVDFGCHAHPCGRSW